MESIRQAVASPRADFLPLEGTDHIEFFVGNAKQAAHFYHSVLGFQPLAYAGPETGRRDLVSYVLRQQKITIVLTTALRSSHPVADFVHRHGDSVHTLAIRVPDAASAWRETNARGAVSFREPETVEDELGSCVV